MLDEHLFKKIDEYTLLSYRLFTLAFGVVVMSGILVALSMLTYHLVTR